jgi:hypothetical protein
MRCGTRSGRKFFRLRDGRREADAARLGARRAQPRETQREQIAALRGDQRMQLVEDDALERAEQIWRVGRREQQRQLLGRGEQDLRRIAALALALRGLGVSPVRVSMRIGRPISATGASRLRAISTASALSGEM